MPARLGFRERYVVPLVLAGVSVALYLPTLAYDFVNYDDPVFVYDNPDVVGGLTPAGVRWAFGIHGPSQWHPLTYLSHMLDVELFGLWPGGHHATNLLIHAASTCLLYATLVAMTGAPWRSAAVAALFGWHPTRVESVAWVSERKDVLCALFVILTLWAYARYAKRPSFTRYALVFVTFALALLSKPMAIVVPALLLLLDCWPLRRFGATGDDGAAEGITARRVAVPIGDKLPLVALSLGSLVLSYLSQVDAGAVMPLDALSLGGRLGNAVVSYVRYLRMAFVPTDLIVFYPRQLWSPVQIYGCLAILLGITGAIAHSRRPYAVIGWGWYLLSLVPVIGILQVGDQAMADRYTYLPYVGLFVGLVWAVAEATAGRVGRGTVAALSGIAIIAYASVTVAQVTRWRDSMTLFTHAVRTNDRNYMAHYNLGVAYAERGEVREAAKHYARSAAINPSYVHARVNLGIIAEELGQFALSEKQLAAALTLEPNHRGGRFALARLRARQGRHAEAVAMYEQLTRDYPGDAAAHVNLGASLEVLGDRSRAEAAYRAALSIDPNDVDAQSNLQSLLAGGSRPPKPSPPPPEG